MARVVREIARPPDAEPSPPSPLPSPHDAAPSATRRVVLGVALLLPILGELGMRHAPASQWPLYAIAYLVVLVLFAALVRTAPTPEATPVARPIRPLWVTVGLALTAVGAGLAMGTPRHVALMPIWLLGIAAWCGGWLRAQRAPRPAPIVALAFAVLVATAGTLRLVILDASPTGVDELILSEYIQRVLDEDLFPLGIGLFDQRPAAVFTHVQFSTYVRIPPYLLLGVDMFSLRIWSALEGTAEVALVFLVARVLFNRRVALVAAATLATLTIHLFFSRYAGLPMDGSFVTTASALPLALGLARRSVPWLAVAGVTVSTALSVYASGRVAIAFVLAVMLLAPLDPRLRGRWLVAGWLALLGGVAVGMGPLLAAYHKAPRIFVFQSEYTAWLPVALARFQETGQLAALLPIWDHLWTAVLGYNLLQPRDYNYRSSRAFFDLLPAALLFSGLAIACLRLRDWRHGMLALWFWGPTIGLSFLSPHPPEGHRSLPVFAGCAIAIGLALDRIIASWEAIGSLAKRVTAPLALSALAVFLARDAEFYFRDQIHHDLDPWGNQLVRYVTATPIGHHIALLRGPDVMRLSLFFATDLGRRNSYDLISQPSGQIPESRERPQGATYLVHGDRDGWIPLLRALYPNARLSELYSSDPRIMEPSFHRPATQLLMWRALQVPPEDVERHRGLRLTLTDATGRRSEQRTATLSLPQALPADLAYPVRAEWRGWFHPDPHESRPHLRLDTLASSGSIVPTLRIGDLSIDLSAAIQLQLPRGTAPLFASANLTSAADTVRVQWDGHRRRDLSAVQETVVREEIPPRGVLRAFPLDAATSWPDLPRVRVDWHTMDGAFIRREFAPFIADTELPFRAEGQPVIVRFHGEIEVDRRGSYELRFRADGLGRITVADRQVWPTATSGRADPGFGATWLAPGRYPITVERTMTAGGGGELLWRPPGETEWAIVPPDAFVPVVWP